MAEADILIVDDNPSNLTLLSEVLRSGGHRVRAAISGQLALSMAEALAPDLVMLDVRMPEMDGFEVCRVLKADATLRSIPVIFISAVDDVFDKVRAFESGAADYVTKPFQAQEVLARVASQVGLYKLRLELERKNEEMLRKNAELFEKNAELVAKGQQLVASRARADRVFSALEGVLPGVVLDERYRLGAKIGAGGFGAVYRATQAGLEREVAVKVLRPVEGESDAATLERFRHEGVSACRVCHPNAVMVHDFGISSEGIAYLVMELLEGRSLAEELSEKRVLSPGRCAEIVGPVCAALAAAHAKGIVHRDVKPENVFLHHEGGKEVVKVLDFGIAKLVGGPAEEANNNLSMEGRVLGTPIYIAPERVVGDRYDGRSDVYSLGVMLYQMLSGRPPIPTKRINPHAILLRTVQLEPTSLREANPAVSASIEAIVMRALAKRPEDRPTASELGRAFVAEVLAEGERGPTGPPPAAAGVTPASGTDAVTVMSTTSTSATRPVDHSTSS